MLTFTHSMHDIAVNLPVTLRGEHDTDAQQSSTMSLDRTGEGNLIDVVGIAPSSESRCGMHTSIEPDSPRS
jgi:hypothetical protein